MSSHKDRTLSALLDTLLPGDGSFPQASATGLMRRMLAHDRFAPTVDPVLAGLPAGFHELDAQARARAVRDFEDARPEAFGALLTGAYSLYYTDPDVAGAIARLTGYETRPPQPTGYELPPFDPELLAVPARRSPLYRPTPEVSND